MTLSPFYLVWFLYLITNFLALLVAIPDQGMMLEWHFFYLRPESLLFSFLAQVFFLAIILFLFLAGSSRESDLNIGFGKNAGIFLLIVQAAFLQFNLANGVNVAGGGARFEEVSLVNYIFIFLQPDILFFVIGCFLSIGWLFWFNSAVYLFSMLMRGWMGGAFLLALLFLCRHYPLRISLRSFLSLAASSLLLIFILPFIVEAKWVVRLGSPISSVVVNVLEAGYLDRLFSSLEYLVNRFQHVGHAALLLENSSELHEAYVKGEFSPYWADGLPQYALMKVLGFEQYRLNAYMVEYFFDIAEPTWNTNPGLVGWVFLLKERAVVLLLYVVLVVFLPVFFISRLAGYKAAMLLSCFSLVYLFHGWFGAYIDFVLYYFLVVLLARVRLRGKRISCDYPAAT